MEIISGLKLGSKQGDWQLGANSPIVNDVLLETGDWKPYRLEHEIQFYNEGQNVYETSFCVTYSALKVIGSLLNYYTAHKLISSDNLQWLKDKGYYKNGKLNFSERFNAILGETDVNGAYQFKVANAIYNYGLIPQDLFSLAMNFKDNVDKKFITQEMYDLGKEFKRRFTINYQWVDDIKVALKLSPVQLIVKFANYLKENDILAPVGSPNHAVCGVYATDIYNEIEDTYWQEFKRYNPDFTFSYLSYKITINNNNDMDTAKFTRDNDKKWIRNVNTGQFGRILQNKLFTVETKDRGTLILLDDKVRENGKQITNEEWLLLPKQSF